MILNKNSPLRNIPIGLEPRQCLYLEGIRFSIEMTYLAYSRLVETLLQIATLDQKSEDSVLYSRHTVAFLDAWSIVDSIHRLRELLDQMPGVKKKDPGIQLFMRTTSHVEDMRHIVQHLRNEIDAMFKNNHPVWGVLSWYTILDLKTFSGLSCVLVAGRQRDGQILPIVNPINKKFQSNIDHVTLRCKNIELPLSESVRSVERLTEGIEKILLNQFNDMPIALADYCIKIDIQLNDEVQFQPSEVSNPIKKPARNAVTALSKGQGNTTLDKILYAKTAENAEQQAKQGAEALRNLGALAFPDNTQEALQAYRRATQLDPDNANGWIRFGRLLSRIGELTEAIAAYNNVLALGEKHGNKRKIATAFINLGTVYQTQGNLDKAIEFYQKTLELGLEEDFGGKEAMALSYGNLGNIYQTYGNLDKAIDFYQKALKLDEDLGKKEAMAISYSNLAVVYGSIDKLDKSIEFCQKALKQYKNLGHKEGMAICYNNFGHVYQLRNDFDKAIEFYQKALKLNEDLNHKEGMANSYGKLGNVYLACDSQDKAIEFLQKSLSLNESLGRKKSMADDYNDFGDFYTKRNDLNKAIAFYKKALSLNEDLDRKEGIAINYGSLGNVYKLQGNNTEAKRYYLMSIELFNQLDSPNAQAVQTWLDGLK